jgi:hypothetical protein
MSGSKCLPFALVLAICGGIFQLIALASPYWYSIGAHGDKEYAGLWMACAEDATGRNICLDFVIVEGKTHPHTHTQTYMYARTRLRARTHVVIFFFFILNNKVCNTHSNLKLSCYLTKVNFKLLQRLNLTNIKVGTCIDLIISTNTNLIITAPICSSHCVTSTKLKFHAYK